MKRTTLHIILIAIFALALGILDAPKNLQSAIKLPKAVQDMKLHLGLDLQGGSQLDYKIDLRKVPEKDQNAITDGVLQVITKRVNGLGVAEPNIYMSSVGDEKHIVVELAGIKDLNEAKKVVGKTIQLEFKEQKDHADPMEIDRMKEYAQNVLRNTIKKNDLSLIGREEEQNNIGKVKYGIDEDFTFINDLSDEILNTVKTLKPGEIYGKLVEAPGDEYEAVAGGQIRKKEGIYIVKLAEEKEELKYDKQVGTSHILIAYKGAQNADSKITRTQEDAYTRAKEVLAKIKAGENFSDLAKTYSDDPGSASKGGALPDPVNKNAQYVQVFKDNALKLNQAGDITDIVSSEFGYHVIKADRVESDIKEKQVKLERIFFSTAPDMWKETGLTGAQFTHADVNFDQLYQPYISIQFNSEGAKLFEEITNRNVNKPLAIFVGGELISAPNVKEKISGGSAQITGRFTVEEANNLARDLNTGAIPAPILLVGQYTIGSTIGQDAFTKSVKAGLIGLIVIALFIMLYYRLPGLLAVIALSIYSLILLFVLRSDLHLIIAFIISAIIFASVIYKLLKAKEPTLEKVLSFVLACFLLFFIAFLLRTPITLTLAGVAGVILSIGMAVDANILIFERIKEELRAGKPLAAAVEAGFDRAWNSIRDSNYSSLITCAILFYLGSSIIKGFAFNLAAGIIISMFTAITITKTFLKVFVGTRLGQKLWLFGVKENASEKPAIKFMNAAPFFMSASSIIIVAGIVITVVFGFKPGLDFTGGTLMEIKFDKTVAAEELKTELANIEKRVVGTEPAAPAGAASTATPAGAASTATSASAASTATSAGAASTATSTAAPEQNISTPPEATIDLANSQIISSGENSYIIKTKYLNNETHDKVLIELKNKFGNLEELRFTTIGPTVGASMQKRAVFAILAACLMIALYLAFAFRKIPKHVNPFRFGAAAVITLVHDVWITVAIFVVLGRFFNFEMDVMFITALLTVLGFSVHDTIVVFDRIREHLRLDERGDIKELANVSLTQTLSRSINTSLTTIITLLALLLFGSASIFYFVLALIIGILIGTYSSIFVATPIVVYWTRWRENKFTQK